VVREFAEALHRVVLDRQPELVLEVGMAIGATALAATGALEENGHGRMISIDPFQSTEWRNIGVLNVRRACLAHRHEVIEESDFIALPALLAAGARVDIAYIDGRHTFEHALLDFFYVDKMMPVGGIVGFNDCDWPAVLPTLYFLEQHRSYKRVDVGIPPLYAARNDLFRQYERAERKLPSSLRVGRFRPIAAMIGRRRDDRYYEKLSEWEAPERLTTRWLRVAARL
jgi:hypothetical protein